MYDYNALFKTILSVVEPPLTINENEVVMTAVPMEDRNVIVFYTSDGKIIEYRNESFVITDTQDEQWMEAVALGVFKKNLYLLDPASNQIWKYTRGSDSYSKRKTYISGETTELSDAISIAIDGSIYALRESGEILKFHAGDKQEFNIKGVIPNLFSNTTKIYTQTEQRNLYVLDSVNNRIVIIEKGQEDQNPQYKEQYIIEDIESVQDIYVDQAEQKMYLLDKQKIYEVSFSNQTTDL